MIPTEKQIEEIMQENMEMMEKLTKNEDVLTKDIIAQIAYNHSIISLFLSSKR